MSWRSNHLPDGTLTHAGTVGNHLHPIGIVTGQRAIHIASLTDVGLSNLGSIVWQIVPQAVTDHLQLHWLDRSARSLGSAAVGLAAPVPAADHPEVSLPQHPEMAHQPAAQVLAWLDGQL